VARSVIAAGDHFLAMQNRHGLVPQLDDAGKR
jgi:hypothetical protein